MAIDASFPAWYQEEIRSWRQPSGLVTGLIAGLRSGYLSGQARGERESTNKGIDAYNEQIRLLGESGMLPQSAVEAGTMPRIKGNYFLDLTGSMLGKGNEEDYMDPARRAVFNVQKQQIASDLQFKTASAINQQARTKLAQDAAAEKAKTQLLMEGGLVTINEQYNKFLEAGKLDTPEAAQVLTGLALKNGVANYPPVKAMLEMVTGYSKAATGTVNTKDLTAARDLEAQADEFEANGDLSEADRLRADAAAIREGVSRRGMDTSSQKLLQARKWLTEAQAAQKAGDTELADTLKADAQALRQSLAPKGTTFEVFDDNGQLKFRMGQGTATGSDATTATKTDVQKQELASESAVAIGTQLLGSLDESMVGARGFWNENVVNEGLAQVFPNLSKDEVTSGRSLMRAFSERVIKSIKADSQLNASERKALESALPQFGVMESLPSAKKKIKTFVDESKRITRDNAKRLKNPVPLWALTPAEIQDKLRKKEITVDQFKEAVSQGFTKEDFQ